MRKIFGAKREKYTEELHNLYFSPSIISYQIKEEIGGTCGTQRRGEKYMHNFSLNSEWKKSL
jgi:hypothetical protein